MPEFFTGEKFTRRLVWRSGLWSTHHNRGAFTMMIMLSSMSEYLTVLATGLVMVGLARLAYGGRAV